MVNIRIIKAGKPDGLCEQLAQRYQKRLRAWLRLECKEFRHDQQLLRYLRTAASEPGFLLVSLDERGELWSSPELARFMGKQVENPGVSRIGFIIGGPYGISPEVKGYCSCSWSLSPAVFPSDFAWVLVYEQLYRAFAILKGSPYHHG